MCVFCQHKGYPVFDLSLTLEDIDEIIQVLSALESLGGEFAGIRILDEELVEIEKLHHQMVEHYKRQEHLEYFKLNQRIHESIIAAARNKTLSQIYKNISGRIRRIRYASNLKPVRWDLAVQEHEDILDTLKKRDSPRLIEILRYHVRKGWEVLKATECNDLSFVED